ncbi:hypothetical protein [Actinoplanes sp. L3-i22]|uniref:hypothetical protein n=1 Tax=Actinoplanes sp. L3-i22 TaxID=2836373 RepID=UPI001C75E27C|nr:hypothetical protein [Actinoplanes sp. L3-i22]BCY11214.1 hypothetical protein L3i22_063020 [Actinoplanes sp. L3-i22]
MQPVAEEPSADVTALALSRGLGHRVDSRKLANPVTRGAGLLLAAAASIGLLVLLSYLGQDSDGFFWEVLHVIALVFCFSAVFLIVSGLRVFIVGAQSFHVFANGFVHRRNGRVQAYTWPEVTELKPVLQTRGEDRGRLLSYALVPRQAKPIAIPVAVVDGRDPFLDNLMGLLQHHGIPVS